MWAGFSSCCCCEIYFTRDNTSIISFIPLSSILSSPFIPFSSALSFSSLLCFPSYSPWFIQSLKQPSRLWSESTYKQLVPHPCSATIFLHPLSLWTCIFFTLTPPLIFYYSIYSPKVINKYQTTLLILSFDPCLTCLKIIPLPLFPTTPLRDNLYGWNKYWSHLHSGFTWFISWKHGTGGSNDLYTQCTQNW